MVNRRTDKKIIVEKCKPDSRTLSRLENIMYCYWNLKHKLIFIDDIIQEVCKTTSK